MSSEETGDHGVGWRRHPREVGQALSDLSWRSQPQQMDQASSDHRNSWRSLPRKVDQASSDHRNSWRSLPHQVDQASCEHGNSWRSQSRHVGQGTVADGVSRHNQYPQVDQGTSASDNPWSSDRQRVSVLPNAKRNFTTETATFPMKIPSQLFIISNVLRPCETSDVNTSEGKEAFNDSGTTVSTSPDEQKEAVKSSGTTVFTSEDEHKEAVKSSGATVSTSEVELGSSANDRTSSLLDNCNGGVSPAASEVNDMGCPQQVLIPDSMIHDFLAHPTVMYVNFPKLTMGNASLFGYIPNKFPPGTEFTVTEEEQHEMLSMLTLESCQNTKQVKTKLSFANDSSKVKIWCFDISRDADKHGHSTENILLALGGHVQNAFETHFNKISNVKRELEHASQKDKGSPLDGSAAPNSIIQYLVDKERELVLQKHDFLLNLENMFDEFVEVQRSSNFKWPENELNFVFSLECKRLLDAFPVYTRCSDILKTVKTNQVTVVVGEPGCGMSSQIPQYLYHAGFLNNGTIICTHPCKIGAKRLASYVAGEMFTSGGHVVHCRVEKTAYGIPEAKIVYVTDNILLHEYQKDKYLATFSCIILKAHKRSLELDFLLGMIKCCLQVRPDLRLVITCNALNPEPFVEYFEHCPVLEVTGRKFPVKVEWKKIGTFGNYVEEAAKKAVKVHQSEEEGDIVVILPSPPSASRCYKRCINLMGYETKDYVALLLHEDLDDHQKQRVFNPIPHCKRKIIFSSDCAEVFVTIPKVRYVIDAGHTKTRVFTWEPEGKRTINVREISQCSAKQRMGVVGRVCPGMCYRLYTEDDHKRMDDTAPPEIKSIDHSLLVYKLIDIGFDPREFDFITNPDVQDWNKIYSKLRRDGVIVQNKITDIGRWIVELSIKPECCEIVYEGVREGIGLAAIVLAELYWREVFVSQTSETNKELAAARKLEFCHNAGDHLTELNVFRKWLEVPDDCKHNWCSHYFIEPTSLADANEAVCDLLCQIKEVFEIDIEFVFRKSETVDWLLKSLLLKLFKGRLSYYLGHPAVGYYVVSNGERVNIEQTSALTLLGVQPTWVVSNVVHSESCGYVEKFTYVPEDLVLKGLRERWLSLKIIELKRKRFAVVCQVCVGDQLACNFLSPRNFKTFKLFLMDMFPESEAFVFYETEKKELQLLALKDNQSDLCRATLETLAPLKTKFLQEKSLERFGQKLCGVRAVIGAGGIVSDILTPEDSKTVMIHVPEHNRDMYTEIILKVFEQYGEIADYQKYIRTENSSLWGHITYKKMRAAVQAVKEMEEQAVKEMEDGLESNYGLVAQPNGVNNLVFKIQWRRNFHLKSGYIRLSNAEYQLEALRKCNSCVWLGGAQLAISEDNNSLRILHLDEQVTEYSLRSDIAAALNIDPKDIIEVRILNKELKHRKRQKRLSNKIEDLVKFDAVSLYLKEPCEGDVNFTTYCFLKYTDDVHIAHENLCKYLPFGKKGECEVSPDSSLYIQKKVFQINCDKVLQLVNELEDKGIAVAIKHLQNGDVLMYLSCEDPRVLVRGKFKVEKVIAGEVIDFKCEGGAKVLFKEEGRRVLHAIMCTTDTLILADDRIATLSIHGSNEACQSAKDKIYKFLQLSVESFKFIELKGRGKPPGMMKTLMETYGTTLRGLQAEAELSALKLDYRNHRLYLFGSSKCVKKAINLVNKVMQTLIGEETINKDDPVCVICLFTIKTSNTFYRVEYCGHAYCQRCIRLHVTHAVNNKKFPLVCFVKECDKMFTLRDFINLDWCLKKSELTRASVSAYVGENKEWFHYCVTPLCQSVYRVTKECASFTCPECRTKICTSCHTNFHDGLTCGKYRRLLKVLTSGEDSDK